MDRAHASNTLTRRGLIVEAAALVASAASTKVRAACGAAPANPFNITGERFVFDHDVVWDAAGETVQLTGCTFMFKGSAPKLFMLRNADNVRIEGCRFANCGLDIGAFSHVQISNCTFLLHTPLGVQRIKHPNYGETTP